MAKRYEEHTPFELAKLRSSGAEGESEYQNLRADWIAEGKPRAGGLVSIFSAQRYELLTPDQLAQLRSGSPAGEARYQELRADWEARGNPRQPSASNEDSSDRWAPSWPGKR